MKAHELDVSPRWPVRLPSGGGVTRVVTGVVHRLLHVDGTPVVVRAWRQPAGEVTLRAQALDPETSQEDNEAATEVAIERMRFALALDDEMGEFYELFKQDPLLGPVIRRKPWIRPRRVPWPWEALL